MEGIVMLQMSLLIFLSSTCLALVPMPKLPWSFTVSVCLPMTDPSYDPDGTLANVDVSEELRNGFFGTDYLYCKRGCCGDNRNAACCEPQDNVQKSTFEIYKLISVIAAGVAGLCIITAIAICLLKMHLKKRRLIRDISAINKMNNMKDLTKDKTPKYQHSQINNSRTNTKQRKMFKSSKKVPNLTKVQSPGPKEGQTASMHVVDMGGEGSDSTVSYATLTPPMDMTPPTRAVGDLPLYLPSRLANPLPAAGTNSMTKAPTANIKPSIFSTPLADNPVVFSSPAHNLPPPAAPYSLSGTTVISFMEPKPAGNHSGTSYPAPASYSSPVPAIPWDDDDLLLYFSDPKK